MIVRRNLYGSIWLSKISCNLKHYNNLLRIQMCGIIHMTLLYQNKSVTRKNYVISLADQNGSCLNTFVLKLIVSGVLFLFSPRCFFATCFIVILIRLECNQFAVAQQLWLVQITLWSHLEFQKKNCYPDLVDVNFIA